MNLKTPLYIYQASSNPFDTARLELMRSSQLRMSRNLADKACLFIGKNNFP
ncbi:hypothetical protein J0895_03175 [Phormidium pseudopriestleyi FRX01]|uniref:Uncharacterized protein n=1 Tax=Phormidium pseudopriestleyi FRX01 TaxID=1759528 RepID=A0ABS3FM52_9CYAN|nr:hypothetical protein [Phormidium pseudopriestleyi]MBO0348118.1 hypothetical protein [Phormidium pseudopriestleyi FRX01]